MNLIEKIHDTYIFPRRVNILCGKIGNLISRDAKVLDVGCGDGTIAKRLMDLRTDIQINGIDVLVRPDTLIPVVEFDGLNIPYGDKSQDFILFVDVLHHTENIVQILKEASRVARKAIIIKDHLLSGVLGGRILRLMDDVGNSRYGVELPYNYLRIEEWQSSFEKAELFADIIEKKLKLYPMPLDWVFGRSLHFIARLGIMK